MQERLDGAIAYFCELADRLLTNDPATTITHPLVQYLRMVGAWLLALEYEDAAKRIAAIVGRAALYREFLGRGYWGGRYPDEDAIRRWQRPFISVTSQSYFPEYHAKHEFMSDEARHAFEQLIDEISAAQGRKQAGKRGRRRPSGP